ncbi:hypothetical protein RFI_09255 [Reticulomyxa filosa]|uniref:Uncharacterized protein n=1 Tax=Reticulomyxa filosa TaxID=46433 RepID=X6NQC5_RETFI|nr:hypothetical protein RFI_09255 [Reticulomyxa filosa]|eukprot:ETO27879.1 hypothetical protein RFI_09255 [Reticulomyxa filosa]
MRPFWQGNNQNEIRDEKRDAHFGQSSFLLIKKYPQAKQIPENHDERKENFLFLHANQKIKKNGRIDEIFKEQPRVNAINFEREMIVERQKQLQLQNEEQTQSDKENVNVESPNEKKQETPQKMETRQNETEKNEMKEEKPTQTKRFNKLWLEKEIIRREVQINNSLFFFEKLLFLHNASDNLLLAVFFFPPLLWLPFSSLSPVSSKAAPCNLKLKKVTRGGLDGLSLCKTNKFVCTILRAWTIPKPSLKKFGLINKTLRYSLEIITKLGFVFLLKKKKKRVHIFFLADC